MNFKILDENNIKQYEDFAGTVDFAGVWHTPGWFRLQAASGRIDSYVFFVVESENGKTVLSGAIQIITKGKIFRYGYVQGGFLYNELDRETADTLIAGLKRYSSQNKLIYLQIDPISPADEKYKSLIIDRLPFRTKTKLPIPNWTTQIDLRLPEEKILENMKPKGRYNIKLAEKKGVTVRTGSGDSDIEVFYKMLLDTTERDGFRPNSLGYYKKFMENVPDAVLLLAEHEDEVIAGGIFCYNYKTALYYYGASSNSKRNLMAPYLVQWSAMTDGVRRGMEKYDFMGIADPGNPADPLTGVTDFKMKFGGDIVKFNDHHIIIYNNFMYNIILLIGRLKKIIGR